MAAMVFHQKSKHLDGRIWQNVQDAAVDEEVYFGGDFELDVRQLDGLSQAAKQLLSVRLEGGDDKAVTAGRVLQLGLEYHLQLQIGVSDEQTAALQIDKQGLVNENGHLLADVQDLERRLAKKEDEVDHLREDLDRLGGDDATIRNLKETNKQLKKKLEDEKRRAERAEEERDDALDRMDAMEPRIRELEDLLADSKDKFASLGDRMREVEDENAQLHLERDEILRASKLRDGTSTELQSTIKQQDWKIERLVRENRSLEANNLDLRSQLEEIRAENLDISEKIVRLDSDGRAIKATESELRDRLVAIAAERDALDAEADNLKAEVAEKMQLLDEFELRFKRQYKSWTAEKETLEAQIHTLTETAKRGGPRSLMGESSGYVSDASLATGTTTAEEEVARLQAELQTAAEKEMLLLEAYEALEKDVGKEVDRALAAQKEQLDYLARKAKVQEEELEKERAKYRELDAGVEKLQAEKEDAEERCQVYESGVYGLPQAVLEMKALKRKIATLDDNRAGLVERLNALGSKLEDLAEENRALRRKAGVPESQAVDLGDIKLHKESTIVQLRSLNAQLEREVADLEEERRRLKWELKFRAKYHGKAALAIGLTPEQLMLVETYVDNIKHGGANAPPEARVVDELNRRVQFLEARLAQVQAYASLPPHMRPTLTDSTATSNDLAAAQHLQQALLGEAAHGGGRHALAADLDNIKESVADALRQLQAAMAQPDTPYETYHTVVTTVTSLLEHTDSVLATFRLPAASASTAQQSTAGQVASQGDMMADAAAGELRARLRDLAVKLAHVNADLVTKEEELKLLRSDRARLARRLGEAPAGESSVQGGQHVSNYVEREELEQVQEEKQSLQMQLIEVMEENALAGRAAREAGEEVERYRRGMTTLFDQRNMLYRDHARAAAAWRTDKQALDKKLRKVEEEREAHKVARAELEAGMAALTRKAPQGSLQERYADTVRRMAVVQIKHAKLARELALATASEAALRAEKEEMAAEVAEMSSTFCSRLRHAERAKQQLEARLERLYRDLDASVPCQAYEMLAEKLSSMSRKYRDALKERADAVVTADELTRLRSELSKTTADLAKVADRAAELQETCRQQQKVLADADIATVDRQLSADLVEARVRELAAIRRVDLAERERERSETSAREAHDRLRQLETQFGEASAQLHNGREAERKLRAHLAGAKTREEVDHLMKRVREAEDTAAEASARFDELKDAAEQAQLLLKEAKADRHARLAEIGHLRAAIRDLSSHSDYQAAAGRMHADLDHLRSKEGVARSALNRSEAERTGLREENLRLLRTIKQLQAQNNGLHEASRWSAAERAEVAAAMDAGLAGRVECWQADLWSRKLQHLKASNDAMAEDMDALRLRLAALQQQKEEAVLKLEHGQDLQETLRAPVSEAYATAARQSEQLLQLRLDKARLEREELAVRERSKGLERVNGELEGRLQAYEAEAFAQQTALEQEKHQAIARAARLEEELRKLQESFDALTTELDELRANRDGSLAGPGRRAIGATATMTYQAFNEADRGVLLAHVEQLKAARMEAEHYRAQLAEVQAEAAASARSAEKLQQQYGDLLERMRQQSHDVLSNEMRSSAEMGGSGTTALAQVQAVAEASIRELRQKLADKAHETEELRKRLEAARKQAADQAAADRGDLERLTRKLFEKDANTIQRMKDLLEDTTKGVLAGEAGEVTYDQLQRLVDEVKAENDAMRYKLEQAKEHYEEHYEVMEKQYNSELGEKERAIINLKQDLEAAGQAKASRNAERRLALQLATKDRKLSQLRDAIKELEAKLIHAMQRNSDIVMKESSWREQEYADQRVQQLQREKAEFASRCDAAEQQLALLQMALADKDRQLAGIQKLLEEEEKIAHDLKAQLQKERAKVTELAALAQQQGSGDSLTKALASHHVDQKVEEYERRIHALETQNRQLAAASAKGDVPSTSGGEPSSSRERAMPAAIRRLKDAEGSMQTGSPRIGAFHGEGKDEENLFGSERERDVTVAVVRVHERHMDPKQPLRQVQESAVGPERTKSLLEGNPKLEAWEEQKKLQKRVENLRQKLKEKTAALDELTRERDRRAAHAAQMQADLARQAALIKDLQDKVKRAREAPKLSVPPEQVQALVKQVAELEAHNDDMERQLAALRRQAGEATSSAPGTGIADDSQLPPADRILKRDALLLDLRLEKDQAVARAARLQSRLEALFGASAADISLSPPSAANARGAARSRLAGGALVDRALKGKPAEGGREAQLLNTITALQRALETTQREAQAGVSSSKYMQVMDKRKELQKRVAQLEAEAQQAEGIKAEAKRLELRCAQLQASNNALRKQLKNVQSGSDHAAALADQVTKLEQALEAKDADIAALHQEVQRREAQIQELASSGAADDDMAADLAALRDHIAELEAENEDLRMELNAFDPAFFEEIEDLKHEHHLLQLRCTEYDTLVHSMSAQLGQVPPSFPPIVQ
ncbi:hypothetical protein WJX72_012389 [[Myrmecia] bisecta]|uniref:Uncharacterized protein n=1 Tax=[Myrmecia] bisecta TaxID=41462 RepID=A0AAW1RB56_9CHLO